jgi:hypothetical protein
VVAQAPDQVKFGAAGFHGITEVELSARRDYAANRINLFLNNFCFFVWYGALPDAAWRADRLK